MRFIAVALALLELGTVSAQATVYVCSTKQAHQVDKGELNREREAVELLSWSTLVFDATTGMLKYGHEASGNRKANWFTARLTVVDRESQLLSAHYLHNGTVFSALQIETWTEPPSFAWLKGGNSTVLTGTCRRLG